MNLFCLIPVVIVGVIGAGLLYWRIAEHHNPETNGRVLVDKLSTEPRISAEITNRDWSTRPCASVMEWREEGKETKEK